MSLTWWSEYPSELALILLTAVVTHLLMSFSQTLMHYRLGHRRLGGGLSRCPRVIKIWGLPGGRTVTSCWRGFCGTA